MVIRITNSPYPHSQRWRYGFRQSESLVWSARNLLPTPQFWLIIVKIVFGTHTFQFFDLTDAENSENKQFFTAILRENNRSWFFKLEGAGVGFKKQKTAFQGF